ncbi:unnamed protein product, partial [Prunus brigantina]
SPFFLLKFQTVCFHRNGTRITALRSSDFCRCICRMCRLYGYDLSDLNHIQIHTRY